MVAYYGLYEESEKLALFAEKQMEKFTRDAVELLEKKTDDMREIGHELKNQYAVLRMLLETGRYDEMQEFSARCRIMRFAWIRISTEGINR